MTVAELIAKLEQRPQDDLVTITDDGTVVAEATWNAAVADIRDGDPIGTEIVFEGHFLWTVLTSGEES